MRRAQGGLLAALVLSLALGACAEREVPLATRIANALPAAAVPARGETEPVGTNNADAADDPAIWRNPADAAGSLIVGTDKKAGLHVYGLDGKSRHFLDAGQVNNVDLRDRVTINGRPGILVVASDRNDPALARLALFSLDPQAARLTALGTLPAGAGEAYGVCLGQDAAGLSAFIVLKDGTINQILIDAAGASPQGRTVRTLKLGTQSEGCVVDDRTHRLYVAEEDVGLWRFDARADGAAEPVRIASADGRAIVADAEGVALAPMGEAGGYVVLSSQGDNAYVLYSLPDERFAGRFRIVDGAIGGAQETDGIDLMLGDFGPDYPGGLFVAQDGHNGPLAQNFKLVAWRDIVAALGLKQD